MKIASVTMSVVTILHHPQVRTSLLPWYQNLRVSLKDIAAPTLTGVKNEKLNTHQISPGFSPRRLHENIDNFHQTIIFNYRQHWLQQECGVLKFYSYKYGRIPELEPHEYNDGQLALSVPVAQGASDFRFERHVQSEHNPNIRFFLHGSLTARCLTSFVLDVSPLHLSTYQNLVQRTMCFMDCLLFLLACHLHLVSLQQYLRWLLVAEDHGSISGPRLVKNLYPPSASGRGLKWTSCFFTPWASPNQPLCQVFSRLSREVGILWGVGTRGARKMQLEAED